MKIGSLIKIALSQTIKVYFKFERLQDFYYVCRRLGHTTRDCCDHADPEDDNEEIQSNFGSWLHASPFKNFQVESMGRKNTSISRQLLFQPHPTFVSSKKGDSDDSGTAMEKPTSLHPQQDDDYHMVHNYPPTEQTTIPKLTRDGANSVGLTQLASGADSTELQEMVNGLHVWQLT